MHGWLPLTVQLIAVAVLVVAVGRRPAAWRRTWLPIAVVVGALMAAATYWYIESQGMSDVPAPNLLWLWIIGSGFAIVVLAGGWRGSRWWRRGAALTAVPLAVLCAALALNLWVGYFPTVQTAWNQLTAGPLPDQTDQNTVIAMQKARRIPPRGTVVSVDIGSTASGFKHRNELVYLPPAWYASDPPPKLPTLMMIGGEFNTPADWVRAGNAIKTIDDFAAAHSGNAPVLVFVDSGGAFNNDTECVNGARGNAADHLTKDVPPFMEATYGVSANPANWGIVGWSMGGTCAVDLTVMHPEQFSAFEDIAGDIAPNSGTREQTVDRLFGGNGAQYTAFDPTAVMGRHGTYTGVAGWFQINGVPAVTTPAVLNAANTTAPSPDAQGAASRSTAQIAAANSLCSTGATNGIACAVVTQPGKHDWPFASNAFQTALPWLASRIGTPGAPEVDLPSAASPPPTAQAAAR